MSVPPDQIDRLIEACSERVAAEQRPLFAAFIRVMLHGAELHHPGGKSMLATVALEAFAWTEVREPGTIQIRLRNPEDRPGRTVVEVLQDDHPFIVDSLSLALARLGKQERIAIHPILRVNRDASGRRVHVDHAANGEAGESYVYVEFLPRVEAGPELVELEQTLRQVMAWVGDMTSDHRRMVRAVRELVANLEYAGPFLPGGLERAEKIQRFLDWIAEGRFVFMGMRQYSFKIVDGQPEVQIVPGTGLGMWRDDASSRLYEARRGDAIPEEIRDDIEDDRIILISKSRMESRIHRQGRLDRVLLKEHDDRGRMRGFTIITGLFTARVLRTPGSQVPLLSERLAEIINRLGVTYGSHDHRAIVAAFDSAPVELLIGAEADMLTGLLQELVEAAGSKLVRLVLRTHHRGRSLYAAVVLPREHYREDLRAQVRGLLEASTGASYIDDRTTFIDEGTAAIHCFCTAAERHRLEPDVAALEEQVRALCSPWVDQVLVELRHRLGDERAPELTARYEAAFPDDFRARTHPSDAVRDVEALEVLGQTGEPQFSLYFETGDRQRATATLRMYLSEAPLLSDIIQVADHFGIRVLDAQLTVVEPAGRPSAAIESLRIVPLGADQDDLDAIAPRLAQALTATFTEAIQSDSLNRLVLEAGLEWREVDCVRGYLEYFMQIQGALSRPYLRNVLRENPLAVRLLIRYFEARHDPALADEDREAREARLRAEFESYRDRIPALNEDRALAGFFNLVEATLRTNFFASASKPHRIVFKIDPAQVKELSGPVPFRELFVHSAEITGIHLRGGPVARGGLRFSDRNDDLREEILGLMNTQMLKNGLIVPVGAKGGFSLKRAGLSPADTRALADAQYRVFVASLLDVTDNLAADGSAIPPNGVRRLDSDDPYLVVAADKGTAHLSDAANEIAVARDFWLGDAFASGGSEGYDHKKYGITARGAWESVKHHFAELDIDTECDTYTVAGIGDMSGDVFGNGLLLARRAVLLAAFDHRHIFLDPDPDCDTAWRERKRLFDLPTSSWADYSAEALSPGGGVHPRSAKRIAVPASLRERMGLEAEHLSGQQLIRAILSMEVDLLWNGGIGTYVRASHESDADAGDRTNDPVRIEASRLRARIVGEGGNLGFTQAARVEAALRGVHINTDAIDNSAGVDLSDHEVNYKVALTPLVRSGRLAASARHELLFSLADVACENVLAHNRSQGLALSLDEIRSQRDPDIFLRAGEGLCLCQNLDAEQLRLPDAAAVSERAGKGIGFTRPELAVLLGLAKLHALAELVKSDLPLAVYVDPLYRAYFPARLRDELPDALAEHRLRREISALCIVNRTVDFGGATLVFALTSELGVGVHEAVGAVIQAEDVLRAPSYRDRLLELKEAPRAGIYRALIDLDEGVREVARFLIRSGRHQPRSEAVEQWRSGLDELRSAMGDYLSEGESQRIDARRQKLEGQGLPPDLAFDIGGLPLADRGLNILRICESTPVAPLAAARVYARLGEETGINWVYGRLSQASVSSQWDRMVLVDLRGELLDLQRDTTEAVIERQPEDLDAATDGFLADNAAVLEHVRGLQRSAAAAASPSALAVITERLRGLCRESPLS